MVCTPALPLVSSFFSIPTFTIANFNTHLRSSATAHSLFVRPHSLGHYLERIGDRKRLSAGRLWRCWVDEDRRLMLSQQGHFQHHKDTPITNSSFTASQRTYIFSRRGKTHISDIEGKVKRRKATASPKEPVSNSTKHDEGITESPIIFHIFPVVFDVCSSMALAQMAARIGLSDCASR